MSAGEAFFDASVARRKLGLNWLEILEITTQLRAVCEVAPLTLQTHVLGLQLAERYGLSVYDHVLPDLPVRQ